MSYCRFSEGDVYAYDSVEGGVRFYISDNRRDLDRLCRTYNEAYQYMKTLRDQYELDVPDHAIDALKADAIEEAERIGGPNGVASDLLDENTKLRELLLDYDKMLAIAADELADHQSRGLSMDSVLNALRIRMYELGVEVD